MLRIHCVQLFYNLSDPGMEDLLQEVESVKRLVGLRLTEALPDETTILNFRPLLEKYELGEEWRVAMKPGQRRRVEPGSGGGAGGEAEDLGPGQGGASVQAGSHRVVQRFPEDEDRETLIDPSSYEILSGRPESMFTLWIHPPMDPPPVFLTGRQPLRGAAPPRRGILGIGTMTG